MTLRCLIKKEVNKYQKISNMRVNGRKGGQKLFLKDKENK